MSSRHRAVHEPSEGSQTLQTPENDNHNETLAHAHQELSEEGAFVIKMKKAAPQEQSQQQSDKRHIRSSSRRSLKLTDASSTSSLSASKSKKRKTSGGFLFSAATSSIIAPPTATGMDRTTHNHHATTSASRESARSASVAVSASTAATGSTLFGEVMMRSEKKSSRRASRTSHQRLPERQDVNPAASELSFATKPPQQPNASSFGLALNPATPEQDTRSKQPIVSSLASVLNPSTPNQDTNAATQDTPSAKFSMDPPPRKQPTPSASSPAATTTMAVNSFSTPSTTKNDTTTKNSVFTPQGFKMMQYINQGGDSPFQDLSAAMASQSQSQQEDQGNNEPPVKRKRAHPEWYHLKLPKSRKNKKNRLILPFLDWSLKDQVTVELEGGLPWKTLVPLLRLGAAAQQEAQQNFCQCSVSSESKLQDAKAANSDEHHNEEHLKVWAESLLYWQYPQNTAEPNNKDDPNEKRIFASRSTNTASSSSLLARHNSTASIGGGGLLRLGGDDSSRFGKLSGASVIVSDIAEQSRQAAQGLLAWKESVEKHKPYLEWQDAFWSVYQKWRLAVRQLIEKSSSSYSLEDVTRTCFYAVGEGHSALFRVGLEQPKKDEAETPWEEHDDSSEGSLDEVEDDELHCRLFPEIVFSSSSTEMRNRLRQMGASLKFLSGLDGLDPDFDDEEAFWDLLQQQSAPVGMKKEESNTTTSPSIQADLVALRRAQAMGQTVGADISVKTRKKGHQSSKRRPRARHLPPLVVSGDCDCATFAELYMNLYGKILESAEGSGGGGGQRSEQVPTLLCRQHLGPFLHSSLQQLRLQRLSRSGSVGIQVKGFVLPDALREMVRVLSDTIVKKEACQDSTATNDERQMLVHFRLHKGFEAPPAEGVVGGLSSQLFNGGTWTSDVGENQDEEQERRPRIVYYCTLGDVASKAKLSVNNPSVLSIRIAAQTTSMA